MNKEMAAPENSAAAAEEDCKLLEESSFDDVDWKVIEESPSDADEDCKIIEESYDDFNPMPEVLISSRKEILADYKRRYPDHPVPAIGAIERKFAVLLYDYREFRNGSDWRRVGFPMTNLMAINYFDHLLKNQNHLDEVVYNIRKDNESRKAARCASRNFSKASELSSHVETFLPSFDFNAMPAGEWSPYGSVNATLQEIKEVNSQPGQHGISNLGYSCLANGVTALHSILTPEYFGPTAPWDGYPFEVSWSDLWHPMHLSMPFTLFCYTSERASPSLYSSPYLRIMKKWYIEYMAKVAESNHEFLLAVISAFGVCVKKYPGRVIDLFDEKGMLIPSVRLGGEASAVPKQDQTQMFCIPRRNAILLSKLADIPPPKTFIIDRNIQAVGPKSYVKQQPKLYTNMSPYRYSQCHEKFWPAFYGYGKACEEDEAPLIKLMYKKFQSEMKVLRNKFTNVFYIIMDENREPNTPAVPSHFRPDQIAMLEEYDSSKISVQAKVWIRMGLLSGSLSALMQSDTSPLQLALVPSSPTNGVPGRTNWSSVNCWMPFQVFETLIQTNATKMMNARIHFDGAAFKVRYVEFLDNIKAPTDQLLIGIFSAFGENLYTYPVRVVQIINSRGIVRQDSIIPILIISPIKKPYERHSDNLNSGFPDGTNTIRKRRVIYCRPPVEPPTLQALAPPCYITAMANKPQITCYLGWRQLVKQAIKRLGLSISLRELDCKSIYYLHNVHQMKSKSAFMTGILDGIYVGLGNGKSISAGMALHYYCGYMRLLEAMQVQGFPKQTLGKKLRQQLELTKTRLAMQDHTGPRMRVRAQSIEEAQVELMIPFAQRTSSVYSPAVENTQGLSSFSAISSPNNFLYLNPLFKDQLIFSPVKCLLPPPPIIPSRPPHYGYFTAIAAESGNSKPASPPLQSHFQTQKLEASSTEGIPPFIPVSKRKRSPSYVSMTKRKRSPSSVPMSKSIGSSKVSMTKRNRSPSYVPMSRRSRSPSYVPMSRRSRSPSYVPMSRRSRSPSYVYVPMSRRSRSQSYVPMSRRSRSPSYVPMSRRSRSQSYVPMSRSRSPSYEPMSKRKRSPSYVPMTKTSRSPSYGPVQIRNRSPSYGPVQRRIRSPSCGQVQRRIRSPSYVPMSRSSRSPSYGPVQRRIRSPSCGQVQRRIRSPSYVPMSRSSRSPSYGPVQRRNRSPSYGPMSRSSRSPSCVQLSKTSRSPSYVAVERRNRSPSYGPVERRNRSPSYGPVQRRNRSPSYGPVQRRNRSPSYGPMSRRSRSPSCVPVSRRKRSPSYAPVSRRNRRSTRSSSSSDLHRSATTSSFSEHRRSRKSSSSSKRRRRRSKRNKSPSVCRRKPTKEMHHNC